LGLRDATMGAASASGRNLESNLVRILAHGILPQDLGLAVQAKFYSQPGFMI